MSDIVLLDVSDRIATVTLNRPEARNALSSELLTALPTDRAPGRGRRRRRRDHPHRRRSRLLRRARPEGARLRRRRPGWRAEPPVAPTVPTAGPLPAGTKPVIGAVNGAAVTGGFELALNCDFLVASERARFADTHARVGIQPGWGLTVLLPQAVGVRRAREMSATGNFIDAPNALWLGPREPRRRPRRAAATARRLAADIVSNDQAAVRRSTPPTTRAARPPSATRGRWRIGWPPSGSVAASTRPRSSGAGPSSWSGAAPRSDGRAGQAPASPSANQGACWWTGTLWAAAAGFAPAASRDPTSTSTSCRPAATTWDTSPTP